MSEKANGTVFLEWNRSHGEVTRLVQQASNGQDILHLRNFYRDKDGNLKPTAQGVTIPHDQIAPLRKGLRQAEKELNAKATPEGQPVKHKKKSNWG